ncbi:MAG: hypothetical protein LBI94_06975 [Treponema sp.]|jgi:hypothetical protein|nr:hypothetical protein [Treponema sp.]
MKDLKNIALCAAWIGGLLLAGWLLWLFTESPRDRITARRINGILAEQGEIFVLDTPVKNRRRLPLGTEFTTGAGGSFLVFPLVSGGGSLNCGALIDSRGRVERLIPLGIHARQAFERVPPGILNAYIHRIETEKNL